MQIQKIGYTVSKLAELLGNMTKGGQGDLIVMLDLGGDKKNLIVPAGRGDIGMASDGREVLVIRQGGAQDLILPTIKGANNAG